MEEKKKFTAQSAIFERLGKRKQKSDAAGKMGIAES